MNIRKIAKKIVDYAVDLFYDASTPFPVKKMIANMESKHQYLMEKLGYKRPEDFVFHLQHEAIIRDEISVRPTLVTKL